MADPAPAEIGDRDLDRQRIDHSTPLTRAISDITGWLGSFPAILLSVVLVIAWLVGGIFIGLGDDTYQLVINTATTIVTFLMVFIIQNTQNRDGSAVQTKLDAQSEVLRRVAEKVGVADDEHLLSALVGVEDAPATVISDDQKKVRRVAATSGTAKTQERRSSADSHRG